MVAEAVPDGDRWFQLYSHLPALARRKWLISRAFRGEAEAATGYARG
jgi:hypothetical protein